MSTAEDVLKCAISHKPDSRLIGNVTAMQLVQLVAPLITQCPKCGSEAWVNIDCDMCLICSAVEGGESV